MTWALILYVCFRPGVCVPMLANDGLTNWQCETAKLYVPAQVPWPAEGDCIHSRDVQALLGRGRA